MQTVNENDRVGMLVVHMLSIQDPWLYQMRASVVVLV